MEMDPEFMDVDAEHMHDVSVSSVGILSEGNVDMKKLNKCALPSCFPISVFRSGADHGLFAEPMWSWRLGLTFALHPTKHRLQACPWYNVTIFPPWKIHSFRGHSIHPGRLTSFFNPVIARLL